MLSDAAKADFILDAGSHLVMLRVSLRYFAMCRSGTLPSFLADQLKLPYVRYFLLLTLLFYFCPLMHLSAQQDSMRADTAATIPFFAYWNLGDSLRYAVTEITYREVGDSIVVNDTLRYEADFVVIDSTATEYLVSWNANKEMGDGVKDFLAGQDADFFEAMEDFEHLIPQFRTNKLGQYQGFANVDDLRQVMDLMMDPLVDYLLSKEDVGGLLDSMQQREFRKLMDLEMEKYLQPAKLEQEYLKVVPYLLSPLGAEYYLYDTVRTSLEVQSSTPGKTVTQSIEVYFDDHQPEFEYIRQKMFSRVEPASGLAIIAERLRKNNYPEEKIRQFLETATYLEWEDNDFFYFYGIGVPEYVDCFKEVHFEVPGEPKSTTCQHYIIELLGPFDDDE